MKGCLLLENGLCFKGELIGDTSDVGEVVFNTAMTGYEEGFTDPSYAGQILTLTYPLIGNYGIDPAVRQKNSPALSGIIVSEVCENPSNWECKGTLRNFLEEFKIPCLYGVDTRAITKIIRSQGVMKGILLKEEDLPKAQELIAAPLKKDLVEVVTTPNYYVQGKGKHRIAVIDCGIKQNILDHLLVADCELHIFPAFASATEILAVNPGGIFISNGPGDPEVLMEIVKTIQDLLKEKPIFGICLGHQLIALALGAETVKLSFGHHGANHPVKDLVTGKVDITSQNHGYAVDEKSLPKDLIITHRSVHDGTIQGLKHLSLPVRSVQYHPEAAPGPLDSNYLFAEFMQMVEGANK